MRAGGRRTARKPAGLQGCRAWDVAVTSGGYLRFPHLHGDVLTLVADDDVWLVPVSGGRAWRVSSDRAPVSHPRLSRDGSLLAWASARDGAAEIRMITAALRILGLGPVVGARTWGGVLGIDDRTGWWTGRR